MKIPTISVMAETNEFLVIPIDKIAALFEPNEDSLIIYLMNGVSCHITHDNPNESLGCLIRDVLENPAENEEAFHVKTMKLI